MYAFFQGLDAYRQQCMAYDGYALLMKTPALTSPGGELVYCLAGHDNEMLHARMTQDDKFVVTCKWPTHCFLSSFGNVQMRNTLLIPLVFQPTRTCRWESGTLTTARRCLLSKKLWAIRTRARSRICSSAVPISSSWQSPAFQSKERREMSCSSLIPSTYSYAKLCLKCLNIHLYRLL